jgi:hypothetical protein
MKKKRGRKQRKGKVPKLIVKLEAVTAHSLGLERILPKALALHCLDLQLQSAVKRRPIIPAALAGDR